jgi:hypothetical protein
VGERMAEDKTDGLLPRRAESPLAEALTGFRVVNVTRYEPSPRPDLHDEAMDPGSASLSHDGHLS